MIPEDLVRLEIEAALTRNVRVIPVLVEGARMPRAVELPASLKKLSSRQALELSPDRFHSDFRHLLTVLDRTLTQELVPPEGAGRPHGSDAGRAGTRAKSAPMERTSGI